MLDVDFRVEKQSYSCGAWRVLNADGEQVYVNEMFDHPFLGPTVIAGPVCFNRKRDAVAWIEAHRDWKPAPVPFPVVQEGHSNE